MARLAGFPEDTFLAMTRIRDTSLVRFDSLFTPDRHLWAAQNLKRFHALFVERFDEGEGSFLEKFRKQLDGADDDVLCSCAALKPCGKGRIHHHKLCDTVPLTAHLQ